VGQFYIVDDSEYPLPIKLPQATESRIHLIAVTRGSVKHAKSYWGKASSGSLFIDTNLVADQHKKAPFRIGWPLPNKRFVHVLDETTLDIVLNELDTISDFIEYLTKKEALFYTEGVSCIVPGEEELIAMYLSHFDYMKNEHYFPNVPQDALLILGEGDWKNLINSNAYESRREVNAISYLWDNLIEFHSQHIIHGSAISFADETSDINNEHLMRIMASENRLTRRSLGEALHVANSNKQKEMRFTRTILSATKKGRAYVFMSLFKPKDSSFEDYLKMRRSDLILYADGCKLKFENISEVVGIVFEPDQKVLNVIDFLLINFGTKKLDEEVGNEVQERLKIANMWNTQAMKSNIIRDLPFPKIKSPLISFKIFLKQKLTLFTRYIKRRFNK
tara:strand:- start:1280 stop:2452 length:1173 start_codon:yes stop_codon:yes gene_type:complete